jgi:hypothetical protein
MTAPLPRIVCNCRICGTPFTRTAKQTKTLCDNPACFREANLERARNRYAAKGEEIKAATVNRNSDGRRRKIACNTRKCIICGAEYTTTRSRQKTCGSTSCVKINRSNLDPRRMNEEFVISTKPDSTIQCIRSNDLYAPGFYSRHMVLRDIRAGEVPREDFRL